MVQVETRGNVPRDRVVRQCLVEDILVLVGET